MKCLYSEHVCLMLWVVPKVKAGHIEQVEISWDSTMGTVCSHDLACTCDTCVPGTLKPTSFKWMEMVISSHFLYKDLGTIIQLKTPTI